LPDGQLFMGHRVILKKEATELTEKRSDLDFDGREAELAGGDGGFEGAHNNGIKFGASERLDALERKI
jgi:hypothetical protein